MKRLFFSICLFTAAFFAADLFRTADTLHEIEHSVIRLHIPANSDSTADQTAKLLVRDTILAHTNEWIDPDAGHAAGCAAIRTHLTEIRKTAETALRAAGYDTPVQADFGEMYFPERSYGSFTLPAGEYSALRITLGSGEGQNWWCVMYPALCLPASGEPADLLSAAACDLTAHPEEYELRLKCVDLLRTAAHGVLRKTGMPRLEKDGAWIPEQFSSRSRCCSRSYYRSRCCSTC